ncbi:DNA-binding MarR family transcriptional regulator [Pseudorhizobium tarimense]|uniref:DNA-binding MarR family transcriptional regulator n=1 Tax=Pseudorhizobium tarimense TaxID=1079109 RepID=A0ABV2H0P1_9HYPH|nr:MarR family winged helix-turn-helix transcriptional regulator [Pseudorhizobium tarimense]MCJ8517428.1 MarR family winged helix-turn-helix transcriptional regulator [Pseudorhizobium tarimense]
MTSPDRSATSAPPDQLQHIAQTLTRMRLLIRKRTIGRMAIAKVSPGLDVSHLDVLEAMRIIVAEGGEVTVGAIAETMRIDPSRGSRMVTELVSRGILERGVSQADARRSIVNRTHLGDRLLQELREVKHALVAEVLAGWTDEQIATFAELFERFTAGFEASASKKPEG